MKRLFFPGYKRRLIEREHRQTTYENFYFYSILFYPTCIFYNAKNNSEISSPTRLKRKKEKRKLHVLLQQKYIYISRININRGKTFSRPIQLIRKFRPRTRAEIPSFSIRIGRKRCRFTESYQVRLKATAESSSRLTVKRRRLCSSSLRSPR